MIKLSNMVWVMMIFGAFFVLYEVKYRVEQVEHEIAQVEGDIAAEEENMHILQAEWHYLNRPERLRLLLNDEQEEWQVTNVNQVIEVGQLPSDLPPMPVAHKPASPGFGLQAEGFMPASWSE